MRRFQKILFVNQPPNVSAALYRALQLARDNRAHLDVINVDEELPESLGTLGTALRKQQRDQLASLIQKSPLRIPKIRHLQRSGTPFLEIIREVLGNGYDLVIKPASGRGRLSSILFGSTDLHLLRKCPCPVWIIRSGRHRKYVRILAAVDPDPGEKENAELNRLILELAISLTRLEQGELHVVHAWRMPYEDQLRGGRRYLPTGELNRLVARTRETHKAWLQTLLDGHDLSGVDCKSHLLKGEPGDVIPAFAKKVEAQLVVMGTVARTGIPGFFIGNTAEKALGAVDCSILAVKPGGFRSPVEA